MKRVRVQGCGKWRQVVRVVRRQEQEWGRGQLQGETGGNRYSS